MVDGIVPVITKLLPQNWDEFDLELLQNDLTKALDEKLDIESKNYTNHPDYENETEE